MNNPAKLSCKALWKVYGGTDYAKGHIFGAEIFPPGDGVLENFGMIGAVKHAFLDIAEGEIFVNGKPVEIRNPHDAIRQGIGMVHQHFMLVPVFTVAENLVLGAEITRGPMLDLGAAICNDGQPVAGLG